MTEATLNRINEASPHRPDNVLNNVGADAWQAYNAMESTKKRHFDWLEIIDNKKKNYNIDASEADKHMLACLLKDHDEQVKRFTTASLALKQVDAESHLALFTYIGSLNNAIGDKPATH